MILATGALVLACAVGARAADEVTVTATLKVDSGSFDMQRQVQQYKVNQTTQRADAGIVATSSATNALPIVNVATGGYSFFRNLGTNTVTLQVYVLLKSNDVALIRVASTNIPYYATGGTGALEYWVNAE
jgi:hypothetical protein